MMRKVVLISVAALLAVSCAKKEEVAVAAAPEVDKDAAFAEIDILRSDFEAAVASGDMGALMSLVTPGAIMTQPGAADWKAMQEFAGALPFPPGAQIDITPYETVIANSEWAFERGSSRVTYASPKNGKEVVLRDAYLIVFRNDGGGWKVYREVASASVPPEGWPEAN